MSDKWVFFLCVFPFSILKKDMDKYYLLLGYYT